MKTAKIDWVFWIEIKRRYWFKPFWTTRGANFFEIQCLGFRISIGMPWLWHFSQVAAYCEDANKQNLLAKRSFLIKRKEGKDKVQNEWVKEHGQQTQ